MLQAHADRGGCMIYFSAALLVVAVALAALHVRERRSEKGYLTVKIVVAIICDYHCRRWDLVDGAGVADR